MAEPIAGVPADRPLTAVVHAAGALADGAVDALGPDRIEKALATEVGAAWNLHRLAGECDLAAFAVQLVGGGRVRCPRAGRPRPPPAHTWTP